jgi:hypothetical protein
MAAVSGQTLAGWAEADITPPLGFPMGGRGPVFDPAEQIADPLLAQVTVLQDPAGRRLVLVSLDIIGSTASIADPIRHQLAAIAGTVPESVVLSFSHTHSSGMGLLDIYPYDSDKPVPIPAYETRLSSTLCTLTRAALGRLKPVRAYWRNGTSDLAINRRRRNEEGTTEHRPDPDGYYDPNLWVLELEGAGDRALLYSYACHPVTLYQAEWQTISADFPGRVRVVLRDRLGEGVHVQFFQGLAGSVRPRVLADLNTEEFVCGSRETLDRVGDQMADDLTRTLSLDAAEIELDLHTAMGHVLVRPGPSLDSAWVPDNAEVWGGAATYWRRRLQNGPACDLALPWPVGLIQLDSQHLIAYIASEAVAEWRPQIEEVLSGYELACWAYCQHDHTYLPTDSLLAAGGYEVEMAPLCTNFWPQAIAPGVDDLVRTEFVRLRERLTREPS